MKIHRSIDKRVKKIFSKVKYRYLNGIKQGKTASYYFHPAFYHLYLKRLAWLLLGLLTFKPSLYKTFYKIVTTKYSSHSYHPPIGSKNRIKTFFQTLFGYSFLIPGKLYPAYKADFIYKNKRISFKTSAYPLVSIIIPVYNELSYTYNCLLSIKDNVPSSIDFEIIVIDDCSSDETEPFFKNKVEGIKYIRNSENLGYLHSNNKAVDYAKGKYVCLLNNDTEVQKGWLENMLNLIGNDESIGCVGSKLIYPNNILQEAGGIIFKNANGANFGRLEDPNQPQYNFIREVDYCSAASILFRKSDFLKVGKFDTRYAPAYYEDTDLCFSFRNILHKKVMYHPLSSVIHYEGITSGKEIKEGSVKNYQGINRLKFQEKWSTFLKDHDPEGYNRSYRRLLPSSAVMVVEWDLPTFDKDSGSLRLFRIMYLLKELNYHVIFIPETGKKTEPYYSSLIKKGIEVRFDLNSWHSINDFAEVDYFPSVEYIWISRPDLNALYKDKISVFRNAKWIYDTVDLHHIRMLREAQLIKDNSSQLTVANDMKELEIVLAQEADLSITVTDVEKQTLESYDAKNVAIIPNIHIPKTLKNFKSFSERSGLVFIGGYKHVPNVDAALWLVHEIMPIVWQSMPDVSLHLLGSNPPEEVLQLAGKRVIIPGYIRDVSSYFLDSKVFIAPLRYGAGMKGKIGQALEYYLPIVSTSIGAEGMGLKNEKSALIADETDDFAAKIVRLYNDQDLWERISHESTSAIFPYSPEVVSNTLKNLLDNLQDEKTVVFQN